MARIRPETSFETTLSSGITASQNTIPLTTAPTETSGYMVIEPGTSNKEIIKYTGVSSTTLTGVSRGLALTGSDDSAGTGKAHAAGVTVSMTNVHYYMEQLPHISEANTWTAEQTFETANINIGDGSTDEDEQITANNGDANPPFIRYDAGDNKWYISNNGVDTVDIAAGGSGLTAGTDITIVGSAINLDSTITQDIAFTGSPTSTTPSADTDIAIKSYVDTTALNIYKTGVTTRAFDAASGDQTIAHGLGVAPKFVRITVRCVQASNYMYSTGSYDLTNTVALYGEEGNTTNQTSSYVAVLNDGTNSQSATISVDATNITLSWTKGSSPSSATMNILWEAIY